ncbi:MAG TPA: hypothetical protein VE871_04970 [Longimicrobium sp.]|nr:hypothetical protein [Longimicrobium sp.]
MTIDMPSDWEQQLDDMARQQGTTPESLVLSAVKHMLSPAEPEQGTPPPGSMAEFLEGYVGVFDSRDWAPGGSVLQPIPGR